MYHLPGKNRRWVVKFSHRLLRDEATHADLKKYQSICEKGFVRDSVRNSLKVLWWVRLEPSDVLFVGIIIISALLIIVPWVLW